MELTNRRFAVFLVSGLSLAVVVGLLVWKVSDSGVNIHSQETEFAGQPVAAADSSSNLTSSPESSSSGMSSTENPDSDVAAGSADSGDGQSAGAVNDPLAPPNANLDGNQGGTQEAPYYRPTNAAPAPQNARSSAPAQTQQPNSNGSAKSTAPGEAPRATSPTVVPPEPHEPSRPSPTGQAHNSEPAPKPDTEAELQSGSEIIEEALQSGSEALDAAREAAGGDAQPKKRPEDPFSASTRVPGIPDGKGQAAGEEAPALNTGQDNAPAGTEAAAEQPES